MLLVAAESTNWIRLMRSRQVGDGRYLRTAGTIFLKNARWKQVRLLGNDFATYIYR